MKNNQYKIIRKIGEGQFGDIFLGVSQVTKQQFAIKLMNSKHKSKEAVILSQLQHPNIIRLVQEIHQTYQHMIVLEYASQGDLRQYTRQNFTIGSIPERNIKSWFLQLCLALYYLHSQMLVIHRDIKAINVLVMENELIKLSDFGLAQKINSTQQEDKNPCGTPYFLSPQTIMSNSYSTKSDIWSLGCLFYELCTGEKPFKGKSIGQIFHSIVHDSYDSFPENISYEPWFQELLHSMLQKDPRKRPSIISILENEELKKEFALLQKKYKEYEDMTYPIKQMPTTKHNLVEQKINFNMKLLDETLKTTKREKIIKIPENVKLEQKHSNSSKHVQRFKFEKRSLKFMLESKQYQKDRVNQD